MRKVAVGLLLFVVCSGCFEPSEYGPFEVTPPGEDFCVINPEAPACTGGSSPKEPLLPPLTCIGPVPTESAWDAEPGPIQAPGDPVPFDPDTPPEATPADADPCEIAPATCEGNQPPFWQLTDFQPQSCGFEATYGLDEFRGKVTVFVLLASW